jgi:tetratricopeptide (TPR) repeat protein
MFASLIGLMVHSIVDFPLRIPAIALAGSCLLGLLSAMPADRRGAEAPRRRTGHLLLLLIALALLGVSGFRLLAAARNGAGFDRQYAAVREEVDRLSRGEAAAAAPGPASSTALAVRSCMLARPIDLRVHRLAFELARLQGNRTDMEGALVRATMARPALSSTFHDLGKFLLGQGRFGEGLAAFRRSLELDSEYLDEIYDYCLQIFSRRFQRFEFIFPDEPEVRERLGALLQSSGLADQSLEQFRWCVSRRPDRAILHAKIAEIHQEQGDYAKALAAIEEALRLDPTGRDRYSLTRADVLRKMGDLDGAIKACEALLSANPEYQEGYVLLASCYIEKGEDWKAVSVYRAALWRTPKGSRIHRLLGDHYSRLGQQGEALEEYQAGLRKASGTQQRKLLLYRLGLCYEKQNRFAEALEALAESAAISVGGRQTLDQRVARAIMRIEGKIPLPATGGPSPGES